MSKYKLGIIAPVPLYYHTPLYRRLAESKEIDLTVFYCSDESLRGADIEKMYCAKGSIVDKDDLIGGYKCKFLKNYSWSPSILKWPFGLLNFGVWNEIKMGKYSAVIIQSWTNVTWWVAFIACLVYKTPVLFMTDANVLAESLKPAWKIKLKKIVLGGFLFKQARGFLASGILNGKLYEYYGVPKNKIKLFPFSWGYKEVVEKFEQSRKNRDEERKKMGINEEDFIILYAGRLSSEKMPLIVIDAYAKVKRKNKKLFLVGDGVLKSDAERRIENLKLQGISITGFKPRNQVFEYYNIADVLVLPSKFETWGIVVNEAMCFDLPVITSDMVGAAPDLIDDGQNGFIFKMNNAEDLAEKIEKLMSLSKDEILDFRRKAKKKILSWIDSVNPEDQIIKFIKNF